MKTIKVTAENIRDGVSEDCTRCPIALALRDAGFTKVVVSDCLRAEEFPGNIRHTKKTANFVQRFDAGESVKPFSFKLDIS